MVMQAAQQAARPSSPAIPNMEQAAAPTGRQSGTTVPPAFPGRDPNNDVPVGAVVISVVFFAMVAAVFILGPVARAFARRMDRKGDLMQATGGELAPKLAQLQDSVDAMAIELERISEGQRFTTRLMSERAAPAPVEQQRLG